MPVAKFLDTNGLEYFWSKVTGYVDDSIVSLSGEVVNIPPILLPTEISVSVSSSSPIILEYVDEKDTPSTYEIDSESIYYSDIEHGTLTSGTPSGIATFTAPVERDVAQGTGTLEKISIVANVTLHYPNESDIILRPSEEWPFIVDSIPSIGSSVECILDDFYNENYYDPRINDNSFGDDSILTGSLAASGFNLGQFKLVLTRTAETSYRVSIVWKASNDTGIYGSNILITAEKRDGTISTYAIPTADLKTAVYQGATASANGASGLVPAAMSADKDKYLKGDGTWDNEVAVLAADPTSSTAKTFSVVLSDDPISSSSAIPVTTTGNQTIAGQKTFTSGIYGGSITLASDASTFDVSQAVCFTKTITANTTLSFSNVPAGCVCCVSVILVNGGNYAVTWPSSVKWTDNVVPVLTQNGTDVLTFITCTGGNVWYGATACTGVTA